MPISYQKMEKSQLLSIRHLPASRMADLRKAGSGYDLPLSRFGAIMSTICLFPRRADSQMENNRRKKTDKMEDL